MKSGILVSVTGRTLAFEDGSRVDVEEGVFVKIDGQPAGLVNLIAGDTVEQHFGEDGRLAVLKVVRTVASKQAPVYTPAVDYFAKWDAKKKKCVRCGERIPFGWRKYCSPQCRERSRPARKDAARLPCSIVALLPRFALGI